jgi:hypothetical protein
MTEWTESFLEVCWRARKFHWAWEDMQKKTHRNYYIFSYDLAMARMHLMCAQAVYSVKVRQPIE